MEEEEALQTRGPVRPRRNRPLTVHALQELLQKTPQEVLLRLASEGGGLEEVVQDMNLDPARLLLLLKLMVRAFTPLTLMSCHGQIRSIVEKMLQADFLNFTVLAFVMEDTGRSQQDRREVLAGTLALVNFALTISPRAAFPKVFMFPDRLREKLRDLPDEDLRMQLERFEAAVRQQQQIMQAQSQPERDRSRGDHTHGMRLQADEAQAAEQFRALPLIPTVRDLTADEEIFIRRNRESGRYNDLEEYLDIQFRLFRADFVIPLRESIMKYLGSEDAEASRESGRGVRVYRDVQIVRPVCADRDLAYRISFDVSGFTSVDWSTTQRLKFGSLLCLSSDKFHTCLYAVVKEHDADLLSNGLVDVVFILEREELARVIEIPRDQRFVMVESPAYFEAYRHVLQGLKNLTDQNFAFTRYIVACHNDINPPDYLQRRGNARYDFRPLLDDQFIIRDQEDRAAAALADLGLGEADLDAEEVVRNIEAGGVDILSDQEWPSHRELKLDVTQYHALRRALTRELALVQGPPGTGKTYLGLKILKMLLHNSQAWNDPGEKCPLLIICYTNHALDQFLEGVLDFFQGSLVRVGARSNSDRLKEVNLTNYRKRARDTQQVPMEIHEAKIRVRLELKKLSLGIHQEAAKLEIAEQEIVKEDFLMNFISASTLEEFKKCFRKGEEGSAILKWLKLELIHERLKHQAEHRERDLPSFKAAAKAQRRSHAPTSPPSHFEEDYDEEEDDDDDGDVTISLAASFQDSTLSRRLDIDDDDDDDDDFFFQELELGEVDLDREESEAEALRRRQRQQEAETLTLKRESIALDITGFCMAEDGNVRDRTVGRSSKERDKEVGDVLRRLKLQYKRRIQALLRSVDKMSQEEEEKVGSVWAMKVKDRWRLYRLWTDLFCRQTRGEIRQQEEQYFDLARKYREILEQEDGSILRKQTVIGMTTTGAARYQALLQTIGPRVIVVEEAAEVFEAHVVATLSDKCQHLILIGDHQQLRPNPTVHDLAKKANLDVSLFERMIKNKFHVNCLSFQHRMRPEISRMMTLIYPNLQDHEVVRNMPEVKGVAHSVYYITHPHPESRDEETRSFSNPHEAEYLLALCDYLLKQGYLREQITILTPYSGQIRQLARDMSRKKFDRVRVSSVDNYQGEENDIVLLSLVRSNTDNDIGFLKFDNRVCVALSRAKMGFYVIGNFEVLQNSSELLRKVVDSAHAWRILGEGLPLACQNHPREAHILAKTAADFKKAPEGGCNRRCDVRLRCGHLCPRVCHTGTDHDDVLCHMPCVRECPDCKQKCAGEHPCCGHKHCLRKTEKVIPRCGHTQTMSCGLDPMTQQCLEPCRRALPCGHPCQELCGQPCTPQCHSSVTVVASGCGHEHEAKCFEQLTAPCSQSCGQELVCGHICAGTCGQCRRGRLHVQCTQKCRKILVCGHDCGASCCQCPPCPNPCQNRCIHSRCDSRCGDQCPPCAMGCQWRCPHHRCARLCGEPCDRQRCQQPCPEKMPRCGHPCPGMCGDTCPPFCFTCRPECYDDLTSGKAEEGSRFVYLEDCGHVEEVTFLDHWVDMSRDFQTAEADDDDDDEGGTSVDEDNRRLVSRVVKFPECPQCKTPIRLNLRYGNVIKEALNEMEIIKQRCRGDAQTVENLAQRVDSAKRRAPLELRPKVDALFTEGEVLSEARLAAQFYQITMVIDTNKLIRQVSSAETRWPDMAPTYKTVDGDLQHLLEWTLTPRLVLSDQEHFDVRQEFQRLKILLHLLYCRDAIREDKLEVQPRIMRRLAATIRQLMNGLPLPENDLEEGRQLQDELKDVVEDPFSALTEQEREAIVKAVNLPTGSWYACPRGHYYAIGDCGRPTEAATCPECRAAVGGENHALARGNRHAPEFDNAEGPRWTQEEDEQFALRLQMAEWENWH